ncbi:hypothetical protein C8F04DRAFT_1193674 [Mycena alexandri]|uniref:Uncharacterized protein n=1 Tax=Mycena alexandri TaxID=1745969 RepID=A0AAD6WVZ7_9AGAR|nr:hypothetical protein C8F04DRAFT_1193674 [Mycena alexandri]
MTPTNGDKARAAIQRRKERLHLKKHAIAQTKYRERNLEALREKVRDSMRKHRAAIKESAERTKAAREQRREVDAEYRERAVADAPRPPGASMFERPGDEANANSGSSSGFRPCSPFTVHRRNETTHEDLFSVAIGASHLTLSLLLSTYEYVGILPEPSTGSMNVSIEVPNIGKFVRAFSTTIESAPMAVEKHVPELLRVHFDNTFGQTEPGTEIISLPQQDLDKSMAITQAHGLPQINRKPNLIAALMKHTRSAPQWPIPLRELPTPIPDTKPTLQSMDDLDVLPLALNNEIIVDADDGHVESNFIQEMSLGRTLGRGVVRPRTVESVGILERDRRTRYNLQKAARENNSAPGHRSTAEAQHIAVEDAITEARDNFLYHCIQGPPRLSLSSGAYVDLHGPTL